MDDVACLDSGDGLQHLLCVWNINFALCVGDDRGTKRKGSGYLAY